MLNARIRRESVVDGISQADVDFEIEATGDRIWEYCEYIAASPDLASYEGDALHGGVDGDRGYVSAVAHGVVLHAYFSADIEHVGNSSVRVELSCIECDTRQGDALKTVTGMLTLSQLRELIEKLEANDDPIGFASAHVVEPIDGW